MARIRLAPTFAIILRFQAMIQAIILSMSDIIDINSPRFFGSTINTIVLYNS